MKRYSLKIEILSPTLISRTAGGQNAINTSHVIPGTTIQGILAGKYIRDNSLGEKAHQNNTFRSLFLEGGLLFQEGRLEISGERSLPLPLSFQRLKNSGNFINSFDYSGPERAKYKSGYFSTTSHTVKNVSTEVNFHMNRVMNPSQGKSDEGGIFTYDAISPGQVFRGCIIAEDESLVEKLNIPADGIKVSIGRSRTAQYGNAVIYLKTVYGNGTVEVKETVDLLFASPAVIFNEYGHSAADLDSLLKHLKDHYSIDAGVAWESGGRLMAEIRSTTVERYLGKWHSKRWSDTAIEAGSVVRLEIGGGSSDSLYKLVEKGIGQFRNEGFGEVALVDVDPGNLSLFSSAAVAVPKPDVLENSTKNFFLEVLREEFLKLAGKAAIDTGKNMRGKLPRTVIHRMISLIKQAGNESDVVRLAKKMEGKKVEQNLQNVKTGGKNLYEILVGPGSDIKSLWDKLTKESIHPVIDLIAGITRWDKDSDLELVFAVWKHYWITLLKHQAKKKENE